MATQVAFQPKHAVAAAPTAFYSRDALRSPEVIQKIRQFYDGVPAIPPGYDAAYAVDLFSKLARVVLASFAPRFAPGPRRPWITEQTWTILKQLLEARRTRFAEMRQGRRRLLCLTFSAWRRHRLDHRLRTFDYCHQSTLSDYRAAWAMWNERFFGAAARRASRADYQTWLVEQTDRISKAAESGDLRPFWSLVRTLKGKRRRLVSRPVLDQAGNPATDPSRIAELMAELFCTEFGQRVKTDLVSPLLQMFKRSWSPCVVNSRWERQLVRTASQMRFSVVQVKIFSPLLPTWWCECCMKALPPHGKVA